MSQTIIVTFSPGQTEAVAGTALEQWAYGQRLQFAGLNLPAAYQVDFSNFEFCGDSIPRIGGADGVDVPVEVLTSGLSVYAFVWIQTQDAGRRQYRAMIRVIPGPLPSPEEPNPEEESVIGGLIDSLNDAVEAAESAEENAQASEAAAAGSAAESAESAVLAESWAVGDTGTREGENQNNAKFWAEEAGNAATEADAAAAAAAESEAGAGSAASVAAASATAAATAQTAAETAQGKAEDAQEAAEDAQAAAAQSATNAATAENNAGTKAGEAAQSATSASGSAATATQQASAAAASATAAAGSATSAGSAASAAAASATSAGNAQTAAETAQGKAEDAQEAAETAQSAAETAAASVAESAAQIAQNTEDIGDLKSAINEDVVHKDGIGEVTPQNLQIVDATFSKNLYDPETVSPGIMWKDGTVRSGNYTHTDFIPVIAGETYFFSQYINNRQMAMSVHNVCCFDNNKEVMPNAGTDVSFEGAYVVPEGVAFIRSSNYISTGYSKWQIEKNSVMTDYEPFGLRSAIIKEKYIPPVSMGQIPAFRLAEGQNILNRNDPDFANGKFLTIGGAISDNAIYATSGFIPVQPGDRLIGSYKTNTGMGPVMLRTVATYDAEKVVVPSLGKYSVPDFTVPNGIAYVRICYSTGSYGENVQIQKVLPGESYYPFKEYEEPHYELNPAYMYKMPSTPEHVFLPTDIYVAVGRTIELYNEQIVLDHEKYHFRWVCGQGAAYKRKFSITGQTAGNRNLDLYLYDDRMNLCWKGSSVIHVVAASNPVKKILPIGDSLTNWKAWLQETMLLSSNNISFVGTRYSGESRDSENNLYPSGTIHSEGRSGWAADAYLSNATYTFDNRYDGVSSVDGSANPFWDGEKFSLSHYLSVQTGVPTPDAVQIFLGTNDIRDGVDVAVSNISEMVNTIRSEYPDMPIFVCNTIYRSNQNGYGSVGSDAYAGGSGASSWQYDQDSKVMELALGLRNSLANVSGVYFIPLMSCMDREYDFGQVMTKVNPRSSVEIPMPEESVHPQAVGYYQMADLMYSFYCGVLS